MESYFVHFWLSLFVALLNFCHFLDGNIQVDEQALWMNHLSDVIRWQNKGDICKYICDFNVHFGGPLRFWCAPLFIFNDNDAKTHADINLFFLQPPKPPFAVNSPLAAASA